MRRAALLPFALACTLAQAEVYVLSQGKPVQANGHVPVQSGQQVKLRAEAPARAGAGAAAQPRWKWTVLEADGGAANPEVGAETIYTAPNVGVPTTFHVQVEDLDDRSRKATVAIPVAPIQDLPDGLLRILGEHWGKDFLTPTPTLEYLVAPKDAKVHRAEGPTPLPPVAAMGFLDEPAAAVNLARHWIVASRQGLLTLDFKGVIQPIPGTAGMDIQYLAVRPRGSNPDQNPWAAAFVCVEEGPRMPIHTLYGLDLHGRLVRIAGPTPGDYPLDPNAFNAVGGLAMDAEGRIYLGETQRIRWIAPDGKLTFVAGGKASRTYKVEPVDGTGDQAGFRECAAMTWDPDRKALVVVDFDALRSVTAEGVVTTLLPEHLGRNLGALVPKRFQLQTYGGHILILVPGGSHLVDFDPLTGRQDILIGTIGKSPRPGPILSLAPEAGAAARGAYLGLPHALAVDADGMAALAVTDQDAKNAGFVICDLSRLARRAGQGGQGGMDERKEAKAPGSK